MEIQGKTAIITGASGQLGSAIARCLGRMGMDCLCHYHADHERAEETAAAIQSMGPKAVAVGADLASAETAALLMAEAQKLGPVRVVVNSASVFIRQPIGTICEPEASNVLAVNLAAPIRLCNEFAGYLMQEGVQFHDDQDSLASIINLADVAGVKPWSQYSPYCASRAGVIGLTKSLAKELAPAVTVNAIAPGIVTWPGKMDPAEEEKQLKMIPAGRFGEPRDITRTIEFLLKTPYITGQVLCVDGGRSL